LLGFTICVVIVDKDVNIPAAFWQLLYYTSSEAQRALSVKTP